MSKITKLHHKLIHFNKALVSFKYLKLLYFVAFAVGLTGSVYIQNQVTNTRSNASAFPVYRYRCEVDLYQSYDCRPEYFKKTQTELIDDVSSPELGCDTTYFPSTTSKDIKSCELVGCISDNCPGGTPTPTPPTPTTAAFRCMGSIPQHASRWFKDEEENLPEDIDWKYASLDTNRKCQYRCDDGYSWNGIFCYGANSTATPIPSATTAPTVTTPQFSCTGSIPQGSTACSGDNTGLTSNLAWVPTTSCSGTTGSRKCQYTTPQFSCTGSIPQGSTACSGDNTGLTSNLAWVPTTSCSGYIGSRKCQYTTSTFNCTGTTPTNASMWDTEESTGLTSNTSKTYGATDSSSTKCQYRCNTNYSWNGSNCVGLGSGATLTPTPILGNKGCGITCGSTSECQSGFTCKDVNSGGNVCWNEGICGGPALKSRIEGIVRGCNNQPLPNVPVWAWGNIDYTDQNGKFQLNKGVSRNSEGDIALNETSVMAGFDATKSTTTGLGYFDNGTGRQYDALQLRSGNSCGLVNCLFSNRVGDGLNISDSHKLIAGGPSRTAYRIGRRYSNPNQGFTDALYEYNFVFTDYHAGKFNFKQVNCPTSVPPTLTPPTLLSCNASCSTDAQCQNTNTNWFCAQTYNYDTSGWAEETGYFNPSGQGKITGLNLHLTSNGKISEHIVKGGRIYYRPEFNAAISDVTHNVNAAGCASQPNITVDACTALAGTIIDFNSYTYTLSDGRSVTEQHVIRKKGTGEVSIYSRDIIHGEENWGEPWDFNDYFYRNPVGIINGNANNLTAFTTYFQTIDDYRIQNVVGGGVVYQRAIGFYNWGNSMAQFTWCTNNGLCGYNPNGTGNPIVAFEQVEWQNGNVSRYLVRKDGRVYKNIGVKQGQHCRLKSHMWNQYCQTY